MSGRSTTWRHDLIWATVIGGLGLAIRLAYAWQLAEHPYGRFPWVDENAYWRWALAIKGGRWLPERPFYQDPLFAYVLAGLMALVGTGFGALRLALAALGSLTPLAVYAAGRTGLGRSEAIVAGLVAALYRPLVFNDGLLEKEGLGALVAAAALVLTARAAQPERAGRGTGWAGFAWGLLGLLRANALVIGPLGAAWCLAVFRAQRRVAWLRALGFAGGFGLAIAPAMVVNAFVANPPELLLTTWQAGANFYIGNGPDADGQYTKLPFVIDNPLYEADNFLAEAQRRSGRRLSSGEVSRYWFVAGLKRWQQAPLESLRLLGWKLALVTSDFEIFDNQSEELVRTVVAPALSWSILSFGWIAPVAALGLARPRPGRTAFWWFVSLSTLAGLFSTALFFVVGRYRIPWVPGLALLAGAGAVDVVRELTARRWGPLAWRIGLVALPTAALAWAPTAVTMTPGRWALFYVKMFTAYESAGRLDLALDAIDDGRALDPRTARAYEASISGFVAREQKERIAAALAGPIAAGRVQRGSGPEEVASLARWLRFLPDEAEQAESRRLLEDALREHPDDARLRRELGAWWLGEWRDPDARTRALGELRRAARGPNPDPGAVIMLALMTRDRKLLDQLAASSGRFDAARRRMARAAVAAHVLPGEGTSRRGSLPP
jgi:hypothetical protein